VSGINGKVVAITGAAAASAKRLLWNLRHGAQRWCWVPGAPTDSTRLQNESTTQAAVQK